MSIMSNVTETLLTKIITTTQIAQWEKNEAIALDTLITTLQSVTEVARYGGGLMLAFSVPVYVIVIIWSVHL